MRGIKYAAAATAVAMFASVLANTPGDISAAEVLDTATDEVLGREDQLTPQALGAEEMDGLQFADPTEQLVLVDPPEANNQGTAELEYPLPVPPGRAGMDPDLALVYDSTGGNGWVGTGWDLDVGAVQVDTRWGAPRYDDDLESETYLLDGDVLAPTAVRTTLQSRVDNRDDWIRRIETEFERIVRNGTNPDDYTWTVTDKEGTTRYYGVLPDGTRVNDAILADGAGNAFHWALTAVVDISGNTIIYQYDDQVPGTNVGAASSTYGIQLYLDRIFYTGFVTDTLNDPPYEVRFLRDSDLGETPREDVEIDAIGGVPVVTSDLLRKVQVWHGPYNGGAARTYSELAGAFELNYTTGPFGKTLLTSVEQRGGDDVSYGAHTFDYYEDVRPNGTDYVGFAGEETWNTGDDGLDEVLISETVGISVLGSSLSNGGDGHAYIGFNPAKPGKTGSLGGSFHVGGVVTEGLSEMLDINGDLLPDEVFLDGSTVKYRLNQSGPGGSMNFGPAGTVANLSKLSREDEVSFGGALEAHFGAVVQFSVSGAYSSSNNYFTDANADGLPDFVSGGTVLFNRLVAGVPTFIANSGGSPVPVDAGTVNTGALGVLAEIEALQRSSSSLQDTVRRWVAPFAGTVAVTGDVTLNPTVVLNNPTYEGDGVRVAIQQNGSEQWTTTLTGVGQTASPSGVGSLTVAKGDRLYFRVGSIDDGARDQVTWDPVVTYTGTAADDVNGLSQLVYGASDDFTLAGRPGTILTMPIAGSVQFDATLRKTAATSDDVQVVVLQNGAEVLSQTIAWDTVDATGIDLSQSITVAALDELEVRVEVDSPIDVTTLDWQPSLFYTASPDATVVDGSGNPTIVIDVPAHIDVYPQNSLIGPTAPFTAGSSGTATVAATFAALGMPIGTEVVLSVKKRNELVAKGTTTTSILGTGAISVDAGLVEDDEYWFDLTYQTPSDASLIEDVADAARIAVSAVTVDGTGVAHGRHWADRQGVFPQAYRGWAYAGYKGGDTRSTAPLVEADFDFDESSFPDATEANKPTDFNDPSYNNSGDRNATAFLPTQLDILATDGTVAATVPVWQGSTESMVGGANFARSSRTGVESPGVSVGSGTQAPTRFSWTGPSLALVLGIGPLAFSGGAGVSVGYQDYIDMNGDGFPDYVSDDFIQYTGPRGGYVDFKTGSGTPYQDSTFAASAGFNGTAVEIEANAKGDANSAQDTAPSSGTSTSSPGGSSAGTGEDASAGDYGADLGLGLDASGAWTNPASANSTVQDIIDAVDFLSGDQLEKELADMNGDGLPDRVRVVDGEVFVTLNLGYAFDSTELKWSDGSFEAAQSWSASISPGLGFNFNNREFSGGISLTESIDVPDYTWNDVDGDGIPDRLRKDGDGVKVAFGTGTTILPEVTYGTFHSGTFDIFDLEIPAGQQPALGRTVGSGGGVDITLSFGPLCLVACYLIVNPGASFERSVSNDQLQLTDIDGDGYPDSVKSSDDASMLVRSNNRGRTNLLRQVTNPIDGQIRIGYTLDGNTVDQPYPIWTMSSVEVDDNDGSFVGADIADGPDVLVSNYTYSGNVYDPLEREFYGYSTVTENESTSVGGATLRQVVQTYLNDNVFQAGLLASQTSFDPTGTPLASTEVTWEFVVPRTTTPLTLSDPVANLSLSAAPQESRIDQKWYDSAGAVGDETYNEFTYDDLGNILTVLDVGETEWPDDDLLATITYSDCRTSTWVSVPATYVATDVFTGAVVRSRDGSPALCANAVVTELTEQIGGGEVAVTNLDFDDYGSYNQIIYPANANGERFTVDYTFDEDRNTDIASIQDSHELTASATYDWSTGLPLSRTDVNGNTTTYGYDPLGRITSITGPYEQGTGNATISFEYFQSATRPHAIARHYDAFNPGDTINTVAFVDGIARRTQTKHDATLFRGAGSAAEDAVVVGGAIIYDGLGRPVQEGYPVEETLGSLGTYNTDPINRPTAFTWDLLDRSTSVTRPDGAQTITAYDFGADTFGATLFRTTSTDPLGKQLVAYSDVGDNVFGMFEVAAAGASIETRYAYDVLDQLVGVTDEGGNVSTFAYDLLGRRTEVTTPDGGLKVTTYDPSDNIVTFVDAVGRAAGQQVDYEYRFERLTAIRYQDGTPDVDYTYGANGAAGNSAGRVTNITDGATERTLSYDLLGLVASETNTMQVHNLNANTAQRLTFDTTFTYDSFGRLNQLTYPDGEVLSHDYDSGGLINSVAGLKGADAYPYVDRLEYDEFNDRRYVGFGNGVQSTYAYDADVRWLDSIVTEAPSQGNVQDLVHTYDLVGNVLQVDNQTPTVRPSDIGGPSTQTYTYDGFYRLATANGTADVPPNKVREYTSAFGYDAIGNLTAKSQLDEIANANGRSRVEQKKTSYDFVYSFDGAGPHQISRINTHPFTYDENGNFTGWTDDRTGQNRSVTWDSEDRVTSVADQGSTTTYRYDDENRLAIERGPGGETSFVNRWYRVNNGTVSYKHIFAGDQRIATKRVMPDGVFEQMQYFMHQNLQGSTNLVTDDEGELFQRIDYFPSGEIWIHEHSTVFRTPYLFAGEYFDEFRELIDMGERWYDPREAFFYSPDPVLASDPDDVIADPALLPAYTYAQSNPFSLIDPTGRDGELARSRLKGKLRSLSSNSGPSATAASDPTDPSAKSSRLSQRVAEAPKDSTRGKIQKFADALDAQPLIKFSLEKEAGSEDGWGLTGVQFSPTFSKLFQFPKDDDEDDNDASMSGPSNDSGKPAPGSAGASAAAGGLDDLSQPDRPDSDADIGEASSESRPESDAP